MKKHTQYDDLYLEDLQNELELLLKSETDINELKLLKKQIYLLNNIYETEDKIEELIARKEYIINNKKYSLIERSSLSFDILVCTVKNIILKGDLDIVEEDLNMTRKMK